MVRARPDDLHVFQDWRHTRAVCCLRAGGCSGYLSREDGLQCGRRVEDNVFTVEEYIRVLILAATQSQDPSIRCASAVETIT